MTTAVSLQKSLLKFLPECFYVKLLNLLIQIAEFLKYLDGEGQHPMLLSLG